MRAILIAAQKGGAGKSTLAAHFSVLADRPNKPAVLVDADPQGSITFWHAQRKDETPILVKSSGRDMAGILSDAEKSGVETVIIDSPPHNASVIGELMKSAALTVVPVRPGPFDLAAVEATLRMATTLKAPIVAVINHAPPRVGVGEPGLVGEARAVLERMGLPVLPGYVAQRAALAHALIEGRAVSEFDPDGKAAAEIAGAWRAIQKILANVKARS